MLRRATGGVITIAMDHPVPDRPEAELKHAFDISEEALAEVVRIGMEAAGRTVPHEKAREWLLALARGERRPAPEACVPAAAT